ncbi:MarR family transcriptional regulator [Kiloniella laminariae]|uniref:HTH-type transcriptional regulator n=1 Tax=Kiloniella laminariae TaxID=454162 RepID=A0ABT4LJJ5_9PROT|nr:MarR family transcriptional regulator [Kiloniella laminariae]MCZ4281288.1 MarR family transcriptional regulator [Kiloniella laminariae]
MHLSPSMERYVLHWGEMGSRWGVNRSVSQIHALLYLSARPLHAEEISETLNIARSNVSTSLKELQGWDLVHMVHVLGDRRDHFEAPHDLWQMLLTIANARKQREIAPTLSTLRKCVLDGSEESDIPAESLKRMEDMLEFIANLTNWYEQVSKLPKGTLVKIMKLGAKVAKLIGK